MRCGVFVLGILAAIVVSTAGRSSQIAVISQPGTIVGSVELIANNVDPETDVDVFTVPAGVHFKITDVIISNHNATSACCAHIFTGPGETTPRTGFITVPGGGSVDHSFLI